MSCDSNLHKGILYNRDIEKDIKIICLLFINASIESFLNFMKYILKFSHIKTLIAEFCINRL